MVKLLPVIPLDSAYVSTEARTSGNLVEKMSGCWNIVTSSQYVKLDCLKAKKKKEENTTLLYDCI